MNKVEDILAAKGYKTISVSPDTTVLDAIKLMADKNIGSVVILDNNNNYKGIVSERDYSRKIVLKGRSSSETKVKDIMTSDFPTVSLYDSVEHCMQLMTDNFIRYLPVFSGDELKGIISIGDVVKATILQQQETIEHLDHYIHSPR
jgi:CBS domain-containing protein